MSVCVLVSCNQKQENDENIDALEARLNALMVEHQQLENDYSQYSQVLASKDSAINAQAAQIRSLLDQLKSASKQRVTSKAAGTIVPADKKALAAKKAELKAKQEAIDELQKKLNELTDELDAFKAAAAQQPTSVDANMLEMLRKQIAEQSEEIIHLTNANVNLTNRNDTLVSKVYGKFGSSSPQSLYKKQVEALQRTVAEQKADLAKLQEQVTTQEQMLLAAQADATKAQAAANEANEKAKRADNALKGKVNKQIAELTTLCEQYKEEIARLEAENKLLKEENANLRGEVSKLTDEAVVNAKQTALMSQKINQASILVTKDLSAMPIKRAANATSGKETNRASATNGVRISGTILDNHVIDPGTIVLYARITDPSGRVISNGTGDEFTFDLAGVKTIFTTSYAIEYTGESRIFEMFWSKSDNVTLTPGIYKMTLYANGNIIGTTTFRLK